MNKRKYLGNEVCYRGDVVCLNSAIIEINKVSKKAIRKILSTHCDILDLFEKFKQETNHRKLRGLVKELTRFEYRLQELWNFKKDKKFHSYWYKAPGCKCPRIDNSELVGTNMQIISGNCPLHGKNK